MHRFYVSIQDVSGNSIIISDKEQFHHLKDVLRLKTGEEIAVFDEQGNEYICVMQELQNSRAILEIKSKLTPKVAKCKLTVACAIPKNCKVDDIIDKLTQLGVHRFIPLKTERVIVRLDKHKQALRLERWRKIARSASQQSQRNSITVIEPVKDIKEVLLDSKNYDLKIIPTLAQNCHCEALTSAVSRPKQSLRDIIEEHKPKNILALIGPEGDFTPGEVRSALKVGFIPVTLGDLVLRVGTAAIAVASYIRLVFI